MLAALTLSGPLVAAVAAETASPLSPITGRVVDAAGHGVAGLMVQAIHDNAKRTGRTLGATSADGSFVLHTRPGPPVNVVVGSSKSGFAFRPAVSPGSENLLLALSAAGTIRVRARDAEGRSLQGLSLQGPVGINGGRYLELYGSRTAADGVAFLAVPAGDVEVVVRSGEGRTLANVRRAVSPGEVVDVDVVITEAAERQR